MLDKHVQRHVADCLKEGGIYMCQMCKNTDENTTMENGNDGRQQQQRRCEYTANSHEVNKSSIWKEETFRVILSQQMMYAHLLGTHAIGNSDQPIFTATAAARSRPISASAPNTPPTLSSSGATSKEDAQQQEYKFRYRRRGMGIWWTMGIPQQFID